MYIENIFEPDYSPKHHSPMPMNLPAFVGWAAPPPVKLNDDDDDDTDDDDDGGDGDESASADYSAEPGFDDAGDEENETLEEEGY